MAFQEIKLALEKLHEVSETPEGVCLQTTCLYPSFSPVEVFIVKFGDGYHVHDGGASRAIAWEHGRDFALVDRQLKKEAGRFGVDYKKGRLLIKIPSAEWLESAILSVSNAASVGVLRSVEKIVKVSEETLRSRMRKVLLKHVPEKNVALEYEFIGTSGKHHKFDFAITGNGQPKTLIDAVAPFHISIASKYVAFADLQSGPELDGYVVYDNNIEDSDKALLQQVAQVVPLSGFDKTATRLARAD